MILAETSAWIEFIRATGSPVHRRMVALVAGTAELAVTEPVMMEVLAGARTDAREAELRELLLRFEVLPFDASVDFGAAATIYRRCRAAGITPRGMIAAVAWRNGATLLAMDADLVRVARIIGIELDEASLTL